MNKKAQLSFETIIIYGLIIVVVTLAVGALVYFGVLDLGRLLPEKCNTGAPTICEAYQITASPDEVAGYENIKIEVRNKVGKRLIFENGTVIRGADDWLGTDCALVSVNTKTGTAIDDETIGIDATALLAFTCTETDGTTQGIPIGVVTQRYKGTITLEYKTIGSQLAQRTTGQIFAAISEP